VRIEQDTKLDFSDVLLKPKRSVIMSRNDVDLIREFEFRNGGVWRGIPIISSNMTTITNRDVALKMEQNQMLACLPKNGNPWGLHAEHTIRSFGLNEDIDLCINEKFVCLDVPNGYIEVFVERIQSVRDKYRDKVIVAGNVVSPEMTEALILAGADIVKVGIGSGSACATRLKTGVGYPQLSAVIECADAAHGLKGHIISDGGCVYPGDVAKAFAAGSDFVMLGGMLAGHTENGTEFYGMSSKRANDQFSGGLKDYRASEGHELKVPYRGNLENTIQDILGGLRSACAYVGARRIKDLPKCATFLRVNRLVNTSLLEYQL
jgi:GMP reductase